MRHWPLLLLIGLPAMAAAKAADDSNGRIVVLHCLHCPCLDFYIFRAQNPAQRLASQGGTVDWFCFWLKGEEDPDTAKTEQYKRWRELRKLQGASVKPDASSR